MFIKPVDDVLVYIAQNDTADVFCCVFSQCRDTAVPITAPPRGHTNVVDRLTIEDVQQNRAARTAKANLLHSF